MREMLAKNEDCDRPKYEGVSGNTCEEERESFGSIEEASSFWKELWEGEGSGNSQAVWLDEGMWRGSHMKGNFELKKQKQDDS
ncbi:hypothetical protein P5673_028153 [Acropora cervicornis]|uniref:Uncharacterized protein n=1 Tax=Acropora cervicornis TaxID=6130 RepID=A0AAD9UV40_ACRCE|nr:hypothetical protein P5673_028153 [Acropora cervicornis]